MRRTFRTALAVGALVAAGLLAPPVASAAAGDPAPVCVVGSRHKNNIFSYTYKIKNTCGSTQRAKIVINLGDDGPCWTLAPGQTSPSYTTSSNNWAGTFSC